MSTTSPTPGNTPTPPREPGWYLPWVVTGIAIVYLLSAIGRMNPPSAPYDLNAVAKIPVVEGGRLKPLETVARVHLRQISHREYFVDDNGDVQPAIRWYLDVMAGGFRGPAGKHKVFRIENDELIAELGLKPREGLRYSFDEIVPGLGKLLPKAQAALARRREQQPLDKFEEKLLGLHEKVQMSETVVQWRDALLLPPQSPGEEWESLGRFQAEASRAADAESLKGTLDALAAPERFARITEKQQEDMLRAFGGEPSPNPAVVAERLLGLMRENPNKLSADDLRNRVNFLDPEGRKAPVLTDAERADLRSRTDAALARRLAARPAFGQWEKMLESYRANKPSEFNATLAEYRSTALGMVPDADVTKAAREAYFNRFAPFYHCTALYVLVFLLCCLSWFGWTEPLRKAAFSVALLTLVIHTAALIARMYFQNRWGVFVTNLYSSAVFIGWGCVGLGLILEKLFPIGVGNLAASVLGLATTIISHNLAAGDTQEMLQAVLDTNFWLATHVTTVTFGYTATFVAGFIAIAFIARLLATVLRDSFRTGGPAPVGHLLVFAVAALGLVSIPVMLVAIGLNSAAKFEVVPGFVSEILTFLVVAAGAGYALALIFARASAEGVPGDPVTSPRELPSLARPLENFALDADATKKLTQMIYGVVCFATLLSFVGTVLGGIWADQSWGRFWGWDPKENGAVLIVLWNALILHARWCGLVRDRGLAVLAVFGNMVTAWSWFGTNQLGIGLHAYGFDKRLAEGCRYFWLSQLVIILLGLIPRSYWSSATRKSAPAGASAASVATVAPASPQTPASAAKLVVHGTNGANGHQPKHGHGKGRKHGKKR